MMPVTRASNLKRRVRDGKRMRLLLNSPLPGFPFDQAKNIVREEGRRRKKKQQQQQQGNTQT